MKFCITCLAITAILLVLVVYSLCVAAGKADRVMEEREVLEKGKFKVPHTCHYVKHYDNKRECYVNRCTVCNKVVERG